MFIYDKNKPPTFENDRGKFWIVDKDKEYMIFMCHLNDGSRSYVLAFNGEFIADSQSLEGIAVKRDIHRIACKSKL